MNPAEFMSLFEILTNWAEEKEISQTEMMHSLEGLLLGFYASCGFSEETVRSSSFKEKSEKMRSKSVKSFATLTLYCEGIKNLKNFKNAPHVLVGAKLEFSFTT